MGEKMFMEACRESGLKGQTESLLEEASQVIAEQSGALGICFSEKRDMLSQRRGHADDGHGFCIGFYRAVLDEICRDGEFEQNPCVLLKVVYQQAEQRRRFGFVVEAVRNAAKEMSDITTAIKSPRHEPRALEWRIAIFKRLLSNTLNVEMTPALYQLKNPAFSEEVEWRLVSGYQVGCETDYRSLDFHAARNKVYPFTSVGFGHLDNANAEVIIGPKNMTPEKVVVSLLKKHGLNAKVRKSDPPYR